MHSPEERNQHKAAPTLPPKFQDLGPSDQLVEGETKPKDHIESSKSDGTKPGGEMDWEYTPPPWGALPRYVLFSWDILSLLVDTEKSVT